MKKLPALATLAVGILLLSGCSQASTIAACGQVAAQAAQVTGVIGSVSSPTPEAAQAALDEVKNVAENIRGVDGPDEFAAEGEKAIAGDITGLDAATTEMRTATDAMLAYCTP